MGTALIPLAPAGAVPGDPPLTSGSESASGASSTGDGGFNMLFATLVSSAPAAGEQTGALAAIDLSAELALPAESEDVAPAGVVKSKAGAVRGEMASAKSRSSLPALGLPLPAVEQGVVESVDRRPSAAAAPDADDSADEKVSADDATDDESGAGHVVSVVCAIEPPQVNPTPARVEQQGGLTGKADEAQERSSIAPHVPANATDRGGAVPAGRDELTDTTASSEPDEPLVEAARMGETGPASLLRHRPANVPSPDARIGRDESDADTMAAALKPQEQSAADAPPRPASQETVEQPVPAQVLAAFAHLPAARKATPSASKATKPAEIEILPREPGMATKIESLPDRVVQVSTSEGTFGEVVTPSGLRSMRVRPQEADVASGDETGELLTQQQGAEDGQPRRVLTHVARAFEHETPITRALKARVAPTETAAVAFPVPTSRLGEAALDAYGQLANEIAAPLPTTGPFDGTPHEQVIRAIRLQWQHGIGEARLALQPENLGHVDVTLRVEQGAVTAVLRTETADAASWIRNHHADLRQALAEQGLDLDSFDVVVDPDSKRRQSGRQRDEEESSPRNRRRPSVQSVFDIHV